MEIQGARLRRIVGDQYMPRAARDQIATAILDARFFVGAGLWGDLRASQWRALDAKHVAWMRRLVGAPPAAGGLSNVVRSRLGVLAAPEMVRISRLGCFQRVLMHAPAELRALLAAAPRAAGSSQAPRRRLCVMTCWILAALLWTS